MTAGPGTFHWLEVLSPPVPQGRGKPPTGGRAQEYMDTLDAEGNVTDTIKVGSPAPIATVRAAVEQANNEQEEPDGDQNT
jgi:hypothetical protein